MLNTIRVAFDFFVWAKPPSMTSGGGLDLDKLLDSVDYSMPKRRARKRAKMLCYVMLYNPPSDGQDKMKPLGCS